MARLAVQRLIVCRDVEPQPGVGQFPEHPLDLGPLCPAFLGHAGVQPGHGLLVPVQGLGGAVRRAQTAPERLEIRMAQQHPLLGIVQTHAMRAAEAAIREAGGRLALIETSSTPSYEKTLRFHSGLGYEIIARIPDFYSPGDDKIILQKRLR